MHEPTKELAELKYALTKETRLVLKNTISWRGNWQQGWPSPEYKKTTKDYYAGTKNVMHERVEFNELKRALG